MGKRGQIGAKVLLLGVSLAMAALLFEVGVLALAGEQAKFPRHVVGTEFGVRVNEPGATYRHKSADGTFWFKINSRGLRADREYPYEKPPGTIRIVSLGDSFTAGYEVQQEETFSSVLERELRASGHTVEVLNAGVSGYSNAEALVYLERELLRYDPDIVLLSFYANDLVDNTRTGLFRLEGDRLEEAADAYVPGGSLGDFLNSNPVFNWLSGYSNAFVLAKERITHLAKSEMVEENEANVAGKTKGQAGESARAQRKLAAAIFERLYETTHARGIELIIQSIPHAAGKDLSVLHDLFPIEDFDVDREGIHFVGLVEALKDQSAGRPLYNQRSHGHWTALGHRLAGEKLAQVILSAGLLEGRDPSVAAQRVEPQ